MSWPTHRQVWAKVNVPVDSEIAELIEALSAFPMLETLESCQGPKDGPARVCFLYGNYWSHPWKDIAEFGFEFLAPGLAAEIGDDARLSLELNGSGVTQGHLTVRAGAIHQATNALRRLLPRFSASHLRSLACSDDRSGT